jgi:hypothetical protein
VAVSIELEVAADSSMRSSLHGAGLSVRGAWGTAIEGFVAPSRIRELARVAGVRSISPIRHPHQSSFVGPAPALHGATPWQLAGYGGTGIKIGILDGGFDGFAGLLGTELPAVVQAHCYAELGIASSNLADCVTPGEHHGTAVAEAVMDMAPAASLYISNASSQAELAAAITWMTGAGVKVINFSQGSVVPEGMGDGLSRYPNSTYGLVDLAVSRGALFVASAGNEGLTSWMGPTTDADADGWIEFAPGDEANDTDLTAGDEVFVGIRWASAASDYDLSIWQGQTQIAESAEIQSETGDPSELIPFTAPTTGTFEIRIQRDAGPAAPTMRLMVVGEAESLNYRTTAGSLPTPADSRNPALVTVGAVDYRSPAVVEPYSSRGPTFDGRVKPDLVAADCAPTVIDAVFCGTSEAAPFVTGAAALILQSDPTLTPPQLAAYLRSHATPMGSPIPNNDSGYGLLSLGALPGGLPTALGFLAPAASGTVGAAFLGQPVVGVLDASGKLVTNGPGSILPVTLGVVTNAGGGTLACTSGLTVAAVAGVARFSGCALDMAGSGYVLRADATGLAGAVGAPFIVGAAGAPPSLSLAAAKATITYGASLGLTGSAALPGGASISVETVRVAGGIDTEPRPATTDTLGVATWAFKPIVTSDYRLRTVLPGTGIIEVSAPVHIAVNATAVLASSIPNGRTISRTTSIVLTNTIRPVGVLAARGRARIDLFQRTSSGWTRRKTLYANADATGKARLTIRLPSTGSWWIRSRAEPTTTNGASPWTAGVKVTVR